MSKENYIIDDNLSHAWQQALSIFLSRGVQDVQPLIVTVENIKNVPAENPVIRQRLDDLLTSSGKYNISTVANTIFPHTLWNPEYDREKLYERFNKIFPEIIKYDKIGKRLGRYFDRMINYGTQEKKVNQLEFIIATRKDKNNIRRSAYQISIFDPYTDHSDGAQRGFPCLQQIAFAPIGETGLSVTGFYPRQLLFEKAYGNYLGLCRLGHFVAHEWGRSLTKMTCIAGIGSRGDINKGNKQLKEISNIARQT